MLEITYIGRHFFAMNLGSKKVLALFPAPTPGSNRHLLPLKLLKFSHSPPKIATYPPKIPENGKYPH